MPELRWKIGDVWVTRVEESAAGLPPDALLPLATKEAMARHRSWLAPHFIDDDGMIAISIHGLVIEAEGRTILVDTCIGSRPVPGYDALSERDSPFLANLTAAGFPPESIDVVLCTHLHFDHVGWNTRLQDGRWVPTFDHARYLIGRTEWEYWSTHDKGGYAVTVDDAVRPLVEGGHADLVDSDHRVSDSVWLEATPGHSPGHVAVRIGSGGEQALITGDLTHHPVQWAEPDWYAHPDSDPAQSSATRHRLVAEHRDQGTVIIGTHYPPPTAGRLLTVDGATRFVPLSD